MLGRLRPPTLRKGLSMEPSDSRRLAGLIGTLVYGPRRKTAWAAVSLACKVLTGCDDGCPEGASDNRLSPLCDDDCHGQEDQWSESEGIEG